MTQQYNIIAGALCPPVICLRAPAEHNFKWLFDGRWSTGIDLPGHIRAALPRVEQDRCEQHYWRRMIQRRVA